MTTEQFYVTVIEHFLQHYKPGDAARAVFERFAKEEYNWEEAKAKSFAEQVELGRDVEGLNMKGENRFFLWYYLNIINDKTLLTVHDKHSDQQTDQSTDQQPEP
jgi:hypothetical protein